MVENSKGSCICIDGNVSNMEGKDFHAEISSTHLVTQVCSKIGKSAYLILFDIFELGQINSTHNHIRKAIKAWWFCASNWILFNLFLVGKSWIQLCHWYLTRNLIRKTINSRRFCANNWILYIYIYIKTGFNYQAILIKFVCVYIYIYDN